MPGLFAAAFGTLLALSMLKFGNPPIMAKFITAPADALEFVIGTMWPINWGYWLLAGVGILGLTVKPQAKGIPKVLLYLPAAWLAWQLVAITTSSDRELSLLTSLHFASTLACFYLGMLCLARCPDLNRFWVPLAISFCLVLLVGWGQRFGGLEKTREYFFTYIYPTMPDVSPEYVKKMQSTRIFSTLFYPNALAGVILLLLPPLLAWIAGLKHRFTLGARGFLVCALTVGALACLYWSGSKGGWLLMLGLAALSVLRIQAPVENRGQSPQRVDGLLRWVSGRGFKLAFITLLVIGGLAGFFWRYADFFKRGATSVGARFDYWSAAAQTISSKPIWGSGPGTFGSAYAAIKRPESEPARLAHNDYLQQGSDSGVLGMLLYTSFIVIAILYSYPRTLNWPRFAIWIGCLAFCLQALIEFPLYLPGLAWPAFALLGWLVGSSKPHG